VCKWLQIFFAGLIGIILPSSVVLAAESVDVTVVATPLFTGGITNFTIIYVSETQLDFSWGYSGDTDRIMIRAQYGGYPDDIPNEDTAPSDGYLIYYGNGVSASDFSVNFDDNPGPLYVRAWGQRTNDKWSTTPAEGWKESEIMTLLAFIALAGVLSFLGARSSFWFLKVFAAFGWWAFAFYWQLNPPSTITQGDSVHVIVFWILIIVGVGWFVYPLWATSSDDTVKGFKASIQRFIGGEERVNVSPREGRRTRNSDYADRVSRALRR